MSTSPAPADPASTSPAHGNFDPRLLAAMAAALDAALLPGEGEAGSPEMVDAARFVLAAALHRAPDETALAIAPLGDGSGGGSGGGGGRPRGTRIAIINKDMPFLVDSLATTISALGLPIDRLVHPVLAAVRDGAGQLVALPATGSAGAAGAALESVIYLETGRGDAHAQAHLAREIAATMADVRAAVHDWPAMRAAIENDAAALARMDRSEGAMLLRWLGGGMLTQLGHARIPRGGHADEQGLGICRDGVDNLLSPAAHARALAYFDAFAATGGVGRLPLVVKSNRFARVHRRVPLDLFIVPVIEAGVVIALSVHVGVWTSAALAAPPSQVPVLRRQFEALTGKFGFSVEGHAGKVLAHALTSLPHDQIIALDDADLERVALAMMSLIDRPRPRLALVAAPLGGQLNAFVWLPRDALATRVRLDIERMLTEAAHARVLDWSLGVDGSDLAQLRFVLTLPEGEARPHLPDEAALDAQLCMMLRGWGDAVEAEIARHEEPGRAAALAARYAEAFPPAYRAFYGPAEAAIDIARLRRLAGPGEEEGQGGHAHLRGVRLHRLPGDGPGRMRLKLYQRRFGSGAGGAPGQAPGDLVLSEVVPALENFGLKVIDTIPTRLEQRRGQKQEVLGTIHDVVIALPEVQGPNPQDGAQGAAIIGHTPIIEDALAAVLNGEGEDDPFNRLIVGVGLSAREANWLRALYRYLRQAGMSYGIATAVDALMRAGQVTLALVDLLRARHQPGITARQAMEDEAEAGIRDGLAGVAGINDDRLLRAFRAVVMAILRTNAFAPPAREALAFKLDSSAVPGLPRPVPWREVFVYSPRVEGIHLRAGPVARGGLRWSDRRDDYRTEILGLMKAQRVKNAVIVPTGAKGGFYPRQLPDPARDRDGWAAEGRAAYQVFIRALLSLTDNIEGGQVVHPEGLVIRDGQDPYFVVAADKGTATFSDTANALAADHGFWLGDAFASGGSKGYDHKAMGITARGAWECVRRHFREMGIDPDADPVRVVGVGDMSGDVFGNGMLLSRSIRLVAAFDHRHVFLDPDPDAATSWAERARLFALPRSSWADYDPALISAGGGVFARSLKQIPLSAQMRAALGLGEETGDTIEPEALIRTIITAQVDLLWFGGIGTYVKAASESNAIVGDPANDAVRVDARSLRARVIGEGANLGCTQAGRIEYALWGAGGLGGRVNADFIDNSAGVDCSDTEVNIKIALASARQGGKLDEEGRIALLAEMTDAVSEIVLEDNRLQALALSVAQAGGAAGLPACLRVIEMLEEAGQLDRATEGLANADTLMRRAGEMPADKGGLTRPELAVLLSSVKLVMQEALERSAIPDDPMLAGELAASFPEAMRQRFAEDIAGHRLRREIIATRIANRLVNRLGFVLPLALAEEEGVSLAEVAAAFLAAERLFAMPPAWQDMEEAAMPETARIALFAASARALAAHMADLLRIGARAAAGGGLSAAAIAARLAPALAEMEQLASQEALTSETRSETQRLAAELAEAGASTGQAQAVLHLAHMEGALAIADLATATGVPTVALAHGYAALGARTGLDWARGAAMRMNCADPWDRLLVAGALRDLAQVRLSFLRSVCCAGDATVALCTDTWMATHAEDVARLSALIARARRAAAATPAMLARIAAQARHTLGGG